MGVKRFNNDGFVKIREKVFKEVLKSNKDLATLRASLVKKKVVSSGNKFDKAISMLKASGRISVKSGYALAQPSELFSGTLVMRGKNGYALIDGDNHQHALFPEDIKGYRSNERVNIAFTDDGNVRRPFIVSKLENDQESIIGERSPKHDPNSILGRVVKVSHDSLVFIPNDKRFKRNITILNDKNTLSKYQDKICLLSVVQDEESGLPACGFITEIKGDAGNPIHEYEAIAEAHGANMSWSDEVIEKELEIIPTEVDLSGKTLIDENGKILQKGGERVVDLRGLCFTTVDPATCKDMDDAIYSTYDKEGNLVVYTAVANVTKYVDLKSEIGKRYLTSGFTTYAPNRAYNILPPQLSTGICSLNPNVDRLAFVIKTIVDENTGLPKSSVIMDAVINSKEKYSYEKAQAICDQNPISLSELKSKCSNGELSKDEQVILNAKASDILWKGFNKRHIINFDTKNEYDVVFNDDLSEILDIEPQENCHYHKVIEAFMLTANEASAQFARDNKLPNIYRVHQMPNEDRVGQAYEFFGNLNIQFDGDLSPVGIAKIISSVKGTYKEKAVNNFLVRLQSRAKYSVSTSPYSANIIKKQFAKYKKNKNSSALAKKFRPVQILEDNIANIDNISHFGLQSKAYSHTTSPIRRISDYVTHKNILGFINGKELIDAQTVAEIANWANQMQDANKEAEREFIEINSAIYCEAHIGDVMRGYISGFKWLNEAEGKAGGANNLGVLVENQEKGLKVLIPAVELLPRGMKNVGFSKFGCAIINRENDQPLIRLCEDVTFRIQSADRKTRVVRASTNLEKTMDNSEDYFSDVDDYTKAESNPTLSAKRQRMLEGVKYNKDYKNSRDYKDSLNQQRGNKHKSSKEKDLGMEVEGQEAYKENRRANIVYKNKRNNLKSLINDEDYNEF